MNRTPPSHSGHGRPGVVVPERARWHGRLAAGLIAILARLLASTLRWHWTDHSFFNDTQTEQRAIFAIWHNRLALSLILYHRHVARCGSRRRLAALVSASRDGGLLARVLELFDVVGIRGSSSRRGAPAVRELVSVAAEGCDLAVTPDGPRGPRYEPHPGVVSLAQLTGLPIVPVSFRLGWKWTLRSWDRFQVPIPFSRCDVVFGEPLRVPRSLDENGREEARIALRDRLMAITRD
ncbi:MAG: hypothetical protein RLZZ34_542 [Verrucomicrobiota bacterium]